MIRTGFLEEWTLKKENVVSDGEGSSMFWEEWMADAKREEGLTMCV